MRILGEGVVNEVRLIDSADGEEKVLTYRSPTTEEYVQYFADMFDKTGADVEDRTVEARISWGAKMLVGIREGDYGVMQNGAPVTFSSDPDSETYREDWKEIMRRGNPAVVVLIALQAFEGQRQMVPPRHKEYEPKN